jgi:CTP synthase (UTP-ammonia lyase)
VAGIADAYHTEDGIEAGTPLITPIACAVPDPPDTPRLSGVLALSVVPGTTLARITRQRELFEAYTCSYELNPEYQDRLVAAGLHISAVDADGAVRAVELPDHPFYIATLFQPQRGSEPGRPHPLITAFVRAALARGEG